MFDIGFSELVVIGVVALVVIGPERLPRVARTAGVLFGRLQRYVTQVKADIGREMEMADLGKVKTEFESAARSFKADVETQAGDVEREMREAQAAIERDLDHAKEAAPRVPDIDYNPPAQAGPSPQLELGIDEPPPAARARDRAAP